jgi:hypothetical protein
MMEDTPANYNAQNQRYPEQDGGEQQMEAEDASMEESDEYGSEYD